MKTNIIIAIVVLHFVVAVGILIYKISTAKGVDRTENKK